jgi:hypothetical protein
LRRLFEAVHHAHMVELLMKGVVLLMLHPAQLDRVLDPEAPPKQPDLLLWIERACKICKDDGCCPLSRAAG